MVDMSISVKFIGSLRTFFKEGNEIFDFGNCGSVIELIDFLIEKKPNIKEFLISGQKEDLRLNSLVLVNGVEISALNGAETKLSNGDKITFIPVIHGG